MKKYLNKKLIFILIPVLVFIVGITLLFVWYFSPMQRILRAFDDDRYEVVSDLYKRLDGDKAAKVEEMAFDITYDYYDDYYDGYIGYEEVRDIFDIFESVLSKNEEYDLENDNIELLKKSRDCFDEACELFDRGDYKSALLKYKKVAELDKDNRAKADEREKECIDILIGLVIDEADSLLEESQYSEAEAVVLEGIDEYGNDERLLDKLNYIKDLLESEFDGLLSASVDLGKLIADELGVDADIYFPVKMILNLSSEAINIYVDKDSIRPAIDELTADESSMDAIYQVAEDYGLGKKQVDFLIKLTYGGSYSKFIFDYFGEEIDQALEEFSLDAVYYSDDERIYINSSSVSLSNYIEYTADEYSITFNSFTGYDGLLSYLEYPICFYR